MDKDTENRDEFPENLLHVIVEKTLESGVPDIDQLEYFVPPDQTIGQFASMLKLGDEQKNYLFVKNRVTTNDSLISDIYANHKDQDGKLYMTYSGDDILCAANSYFCVANSLLKEHPSGEKFFESVPNTMSHVLSTMEKLLSVTEAKENVELKRILDKTLEQWRDVFCCVLAKSTSKDDIPWVLKLKEYINYDVKIHLALSLFPTRMLVIEDNFEELQLQVDVSRDNIFRDSLIQVMAVDPDPGQLKVRLSIYFQSEPAENDGVFREWLCLRN